MSRPLSDQPERLLASDATDFERRALEAALQNKPSPAASARMARALGLTATAVGAVGLAAAGKALAADAATSKATAAAGATTTTMWPWVSVGVLGLVVAGAVVGARTGRHAPEPQAVAVAAATTVTAPAPLAPSPGALVQPRVVVVAEQSIRAAAASPRNRGATAGGDLRDQVALLDSARSAMSEGANNRALEILRRYRYKYPAGSFRPEAIALKVEVLVKLGRDGEARTLAEQFVAEHRGSLLARRVADLAGLAQP